MQGALLAKHAHGDLVAFGARGSRTARDLTRDVRFVARALPEAPAGSQVLLVIRTDRYALAVAILAAWQRGYAAVLPPEHDRDAITSLADAADTASVLHDTASGIPLRIDALLAEAEAAAELGALPLDWEGRACVSYSCARALNGALGRARWSEDWLGQARALMPHIALGAGQRCATSVPTGHPHAAVLGVLVPLLSGAAFLRDPLPATELGSAALDLLVSVPLHLAQIADAGAALAAKRVLSALDRLPDALRARLVALGAEVADLSDAAAQTPILHCNTSGSPASGSAELADGDIEARLREQPGVCDVAALYADGGRTKLCVAVVGRALDLSALRRWVGRERPAGTEPELLGLRQIRRDGVGRVLRAELLRQFQLRADGTPVNLTLNWGDTETRAREAVVEHRTVIQVPADYGHFDGHFSGYPIMAGAVQLSEVILPLVRRARPDLGRLMQMSRLKFSGRIQPGETIELLLSGSAGTSTLDFTLRRGATLCSAGTLQFAREDGA